MTAVRKLAGEGDWKRVCGTHSPGGSPLLDRVTEALQDIAAHLGQAVSRSLQKLVRELMLIDTLMELLQYVTVSMQDAVPLDDFAQRTARQCYNILSVLVEGYHVSLQRFALFCILALRRCPVCRSLPSLSV